MTALHLLRSSIKFKRVLETLSFKTSVLFGKKGADSGFVGPKAYA